MRFQKFIIRFALLCSVTITILVIAKIHASTLGDYDLTSSNRFSWIIFYSLLCYVTAYSFGLPDQPTWSERLKATFASAVFSGLFISTIQVIAGNIFLPRFVIAMSIPGLFLTLNIVSLISTTLTKTAAQRERVLLIMHDQDAAMIKKDIAFHSEIPCVIKRHISLGDPHLLKNINDFIADDFITLIVLDNDAAKDPTLIEEVTRLHSQGVRIRSQLTFYNDWIGKIPVRQLGETAMLFDVREIHHVGYSRVSRMLDISVSALGCLLLLIVTPFVILGNSLGNTGPLLYAQERIGKNQVPFRIYKFRSMKPGNSVGEWTKENDIRITKFGRFLRLSHLDELPQVVNILRGELSLVGPRPEQAHYVNQLSKTIPYYQSRHLVRPGLTGWAQVNYPYGADEIDAFEKLQYEFWYLHHQSMWLDLRIVARTFRHVIGFMGR